MIKNMIVKSVRYFETNRGLGYEAKTNEGSIWNDGNGGPTYFEPLYPKYNNKDFIDFSESDLENMINIYEKEWGKKGNFNHVFNGTPYQKKFIKYLF